MRSVMVKTLLVGAFLAAIPFTTWAANSEDEGPSDTWLQTKLVTTIALNRELSIFDVDVDVNDQVATLTGTVDSDIRKNLATEIAKSVEGMKAVQNKMVVKPDASAQQAKTAKDRTFGQTIDDLTTTAAVKSKLLANANTEGLAVDVDTMRGTVTLSGAVESSTERELIEKIAQNTAGVMDVQNNLTIKKAS